MMVTTFGIPSFVVTLAGLLAWQGAPLLVLGDTGTINLPPSTITDLAGKFCRPGSAGPSRAGRPGVWSARNSSDGGGKRPASMPLPWDP